MTSCFSFTPTGTGFQFLPGISKGRVSAVAVTAFTAASQLVVSFLLGATAPSPLGPPVLSAGLTGEGGAFAQVIVGDNGAGIAAPAAQKENLSVPITEKSVICVSWTGAFSGTDRIFIYIET